MDYYLAVRKDKIMKFAGICIIQNEGRWRGTDIECSCSYSGHKETEVKQHTMATKTENCF